MRGLSWGQDDGEMIAVHPPRFNLKRGAHHISALHTMFDLRKHVYCTCHMSVHTYL